MSRHSQRRAFEQIYRGYTDALAHALSSAKLFRYFTRDHIAKCIALAPGTFVMLRQFDHLFLQFDQATIRLQAGCPRLYPFQHFVAPSHRALIALYHLLFADGFDNFLRGVGHRVARDEREAGFCQSFFPSDDIVAFEAHDEREV